MQRVVPHRSFFRDKIIATTNGLIPSAAKTFVTHRLRLEMPLLTSTVDDADYSIASVHSSSRTSDAPISEFQFQFRSLIHSLCVHLRIWFRSEQQEIDKYKNTWMIRTSKAKIALTARWDIDEISQCRYDVTILKMSSEWLLQSTRTVCFYAENNVILEVCNRTRCRKTRLNRRSKLWTESRESTCTRRALYIIILHSLTLRYNTALAYCDIESLKLRRENFRKKFSEQTGHLHDLLPPECDLLFLSECSILLFVPFPTRHNKTLLLVH